MENVEHRSIPTKNTGSSGVKIIHVKETIEVEGCESDKPPKKPQSTAERKSSRTLMLMMCLMTFEADFPEQFYESLNKSLTMQGILKKLKSKGFKDINVDDMC